MSSGKDFLAMMRNGEKLSLRQQLSMILFLSIPAILAQISSVIMQYTDAAMVGHLSADDSAAIGLVSSTTWLFGGLCSAASIGFTVQIAHRTGAGEEKQARNTVKIGLLTVLVYSSVLMLTGLLISGRLPSWLGGEASVLKGASGYFMIFAAALPFQQLNHISSGMLQCSGNMKLPSMLNISKCFLDVIYNFFFIFPSRSCCIAGADIHVPGADLGIYGAALGTAMAEITVLVFMLNALLRKSDILHLRKGEKMHFSSAVLKKALRISLPVAIEQIIVCSAYIASTKIVSPLGTIAVAAHSFSITAESLCYMPGYGIGSAATTITGQCIGARRYDMTKKTGILTAFTGMAIMAASGCLMYIYAPYMIGFLTDNTDICELGTKVLRIEAFAEPLYGASIIASGVFRGAGDTFVPSCLNFCSMWLVRIPLSAYLAPRYGLAGVWAAMCIELCVRGILFLVRLFAKKFTDGSEKNQVHA